MRAGRKMPRRIMIQITLNIRVTYWVKHGLQQSKHYEICFRKANPTVVLSAESIPFCICQTKPHWHKGCVADLRSVDSFTEIIVKYLVSINTWYHDWNFSGGLKCLYWKILFMDLEKFQFQCFLNLKIFSLQTFMWT